MLVIFTSTYYFIIRKPISFIHEMNQTQSEFLCNLFATSLPLSIKID